MARRRDAPARCRTTACSRRWKDGSPAADVAARFIKPNDRLTSFERLQIYNQQYWWRLLGSFRRGLPRAARRARRAEVRPARGRVSRERADRRRGRCATSGQLCRLSSERASRTHRAARALALDMARVEWARVIAFDEPERPPLDPARLAANPADQLRLGLQPYLTLLELAHPVDELLRKLKDSHDRNRHVQQRRRRHVTRRRPAHRRAPEPHADPPRRPSRQSLRLITSASTPKRSAAHRAQCRSLARRRVRVRLRQIAHRRRGSRRESPRLVRHLDGVGLAVSVSAFIDARPP